MDPWSGSLVTLGHATQNSNTCDVISNGISGSRSTIPKQEAPTNENTDSDATVIVEDNIKPSVPKKKNYRKQQKTKKQNQVKNICYQNLHPTKRRFCSQTKEKKEETIPVQVFNVCVAMAHL